MNTLRRILMVALFALLPFTAATTVADSEHGYSRIFIFGASFIDPGNRYADTGVSSSPPFLDPLGPAAYDVGGHRATNGRTWVEVMAQEMRLTKWAKPAYRDPVFGNYAYDHARVRDVAPPYIRWGPSLREQVEDWDANGYCTGAAMNDTLFVVDSGGADLLDVLVLTEEDEQLAIIFAVMAAMANHIVELHGCGARNFLVADLLPLGYAPGVVLVGDPDVANQMAEGFNAMLQGTINAMMVSGEYPSLNITTTGFYEFGETVMEFWEEFGFTNVTEPCVTFFVIENAYCESPKEYFFWDFLHPTKAVHALLGRHAIGQLPVPD